MNRAGQINIFVTQGTGKFRGRFRLEIIIDHEHVWSDRTQRDYDSPRDAITSARHAVNAFLKSQGGMK